MSTSNMYGPMRPLIDADYHRIGEQLIQPFRPEHIQPASYDITLGSKLLVPRRLEHAIDLRINNPVEHMVSLELPSNGMVFGAGECLLGATIEHLRCPSDMLASVDGKSTIGRCFLSIHSTAGFIDPGFCGTVTLELVNHGPWDLVLYPGMRIGQLRFYWLGLEVDRPYGSPGLGSHYQNSDSVRAAQRLGDDRPDD